MYFKMLNFDCILSATVATTISVPSTTTLATTVTMETESMDYCSPNPCFHNGVCFRSSSGIGARFFCQCQEGYAGTHCDTFMTSKTLCNYI